MTRQGRPIGILKVQTPSPPASENGMRAPPTSLRDEGAVYRLTVRGRVGEGWREWFGADELHPGDTSTEIVVRVADQAELLGRLRRVLDLDLQLVELALLPSSRAENPDPGHTPATDITDSETSGDAS